MFVVEGDEYDSATSTSTEFLHSRPAMLLLNAIEFDHAAIYRDLAHVKSAFEKLLGSPATRAPLVACGDFPHVLDVLRSRAGKARGAVVRVGDENVWR